MPIIPDDKDWTWVLERRCPECGFDPAVVGYREVPQLTRDNAGEWQRAITGVVGVELRPDDSTWSPLEYAAHVRDVFRITHARLNLMLVLRDPEFANWDQDVTAIEQDYGSQDSSRVVVDLVTAGLALAEAFEAVPDAALTRAGRRSNGSVFTVETLARYFLHDVVHHLWDVTGERFAAGSEGSAAS
jgi:hypothetical protein